MKNHYQGIGVRVFTETGYAFSSGAIADSEKIIQNTAKLANIPKNNPKHIQIQLFDRLLGFTRE